MIVVAAEGAVSVRPRAIDGVDAVLVRRGRATRRRRGRLLLLAGVLALLAVVVLALNLGDVPLTPADIARVLLGGGDATQEFVLLRLRLPRVAVGVLAGLGFGVAGAVFQTVLRNPLASPDILGVAGGASAAAVAALLVLGWGGAAVSLAAFLGAALVATAIVVLAWRAGLAGQRFVLVGIAVAMLVHATLGYLLTRADVRSVPQALVWMVGSTSSVRWSEIALLAGAQAVVLPALVAAGRALRVLQLGDDAATGLGVRADRRRLGLLALAVALVAAATSVVGPIAFVAFVAGPIARRLAGTGEPVLALSGLVGALVVVSGDVVGQHLLPVGVQVPVGVVTALVGAPYLLWLLTQSAGTGREAR